MVPEGQPVLGLLLLPAAKYAQLLADLLHEILVLIKVDSEDVLEGVEILRLLR